MSGVKFHPIHSISSKSSRKFYISAWHPLCRTLSWVALVLSPYSFLLVRIYLFCIPRRARWSRVILLRAHGITMQRISHKKSRTNLARAFVSVLRPSFHFTYIFLDIFHQPAVFNDSAMLVSFFQGECLRRTTTSKGDRLRLHESVERNAGWNKSKFFATRTQRAFALLMSFQIKIFGVGVIRINARSSRGGIPPDH